MKSKAQEYYNKVNEKPIYAPRFTLNVGTEDAHSIAIVLADKTQPTCKLTGITITVTEALQLRDWLTDTFDTPVPKGLAKFELDLVEETEFPPTKY